MTQPIISGCQIKKVYRRTAEEIAAVNGIDIEIKPGEFVALMGPSGSGKTTFLDLLGCLDRMHSGRLEVCGVDVSKADDRMLTRIRRHQIGFVFQRSFLIPTLTALENVKLPLLFGSQKVSADRAKKLLEDVGLAHRLTHLPRELSGGEMQRIAIARALINAPKLLLADEPTGNLDSKNAQMIFDLFKRLHEEGLTIVVATHNGELGEQAGRIIHLRDGQIENA